MQCEPGALLETVAIVQDKQNTASRSSTIASLIPEKSTFKIEITGKNITELCYNSFENFVHLHTLKIEASNIEELYPQSLNMLPALRLVSFADNSIEILEESVFNKLQLTHLQLENNKIRHIYDNAFSGMKNLTFLDLSRNKLTFLNKNWFKDCERLNLLNLEENDITHIPESAFHNLKGKHLYENGDVTFLTINLARNKIFRVDPNAFLGLDGLHELNLENNQIRVLDSGLFKHFSYFDVLNVGFNNLSCVASDVLVARENWLDSNPWDCTCLKKVEEFLTKNVNVKVNFAFSRQECKRMMP